MKTNNVDHNNYTVNDIINMISTLQNEQTTKFNDKYNFSEYIGKPVSKLDSVKDLYKVSSTLWGDLNRIVNVDFVSQETQEETLNNIAELIEKYSSYIIVDMEAFGIFALNIKLKKD
jgi:hypothetical protein